MQRRKSPAATMGGSRRSKQRRERADARGEDADEPAVASASESEAPTVSWMMPTMRVIHAQMCRLESACWVLAKNWAFPTVAMP
jgi:hypothetical protein